ncbi:MAG: DUF3108 domain-containing protein [Deltaproteobacteria bacterium]|nr:DUF3108 domain-containing protein [Deltaproteobacteria bacterium]
MALAAALAVALAAPPCGLPPLAAERRLSTGETLSYDVAVMGIVKAGTLQLATEAPMLQGSQVPLRARVRTTSVFAKVRRLKGVALSWVDAGTLRPQRFRDDVDQDGLRRTTDTRFDRPGPLVKMSWTSGADKGSVEFQRQHEPLDALSAIYLLRAAELRPGDELCFDLLANRRYWRFRGTVADKVEDVDTEAGRFRTVRIDARVVRADDATQSRPLHLWFSTDRRKLLVAVVSEVDLGPVQAMLTRVSPGS